MSWNPFRDSWRHWSDDPSQQGDTQERQGLADWRSTHSIDPNTGDIIGSPGLVPAEAGLEYQFLHEQGRDRARQARMRSAANYARGALGLMQSFRPGGGATLEAGQYNALAQIEQNRAQMLQPLDLLGDYRRHESAQANQRANRARETSTIVQLAALAVSAFTGGAGGAALAGLGMAGNALFGGGRGAQSAPTDEERSYQARTAQVVGHGTTPGYGRDVPQAPPTGEQQQLQQEERGLGMQYQQPEQQQPQQKKLPQAQPQQPGAPGQQQQGGQGGPAGAGGGFAPMGGMGPVGADGNFQPVAYASAAAAGMVDPMQNVVMSLSLADRLDADPAWSQISFAVDQRLRQRVRGVAA